MEAEADGETLAKRFSLDQDKTKESGQDPDAKTLKEGALQGRSRSRTGGSNGKDPNVSENGGAASKDVFAEESEMNGASTLMKMQRSGGGEGLKGLDSVLDAIDSDDVSNDERKGSTSEVNGRSSVSKEGDQDGETVGFSRDDGRRGSRRDDDGGGVGDGSCEFNEGDFVWGKVKSHPWWPGRVYDPSNASDHANKVKQRDKTLVAYFGDRTFAWCNPSQLKPLEEQFVEMSKQSGSRNFVNAVDGLLDEVAVLVGSKMLCSCVAKENLAGLGRPIAINAGIKEEVLVPQGGLEKFPSLFFEPSHCLSRLKGFAQLSGVDNMLEFTVLKSFFSAFFSTKRGSLLPAYHDPQPIPGLEDETENLENFNNSSGKGVNVTLGPLEVYTPPVGPESQQNMQCVLQKCQEAQEDRLCQKQKQKSLAEIIGHTTDAKTEIREEDVDKKQTAPSGEKASKVEKKKRKERGEGEGEDVKGKDDVQDSAKGSLFGRKKRKIGNEDDGEEASRSSAVSVPRKSKRKSTDGDVDAESTLSSLEKKKAAKLPESDEAADITISGLVKDGGEIKSHSKKKSKKKETSDSENGGSAEGKGKSIGGGGSQNERAANELAGERRERRKSKYLSFPYVTVKKEQKKEEMEEESVKISSETQPGKPMTRSASNLSVSPVEKSTEEHGRGHESSASGPRKPQQYEEKISDARNAKAPAVEVLSRLRSAARDPLHVEGDNSLDKVDGFLSDFRSSITLDGSKDKLHGQKQEGKRKISKKSSPLLSNMVQDLAGSRSPNDKTRASKTKKAKDAKSDQSKEKKAAEANTVEEGTAVLLISFKTASTLPTKDDLLKTYEKYGALRLEDEDLYDQKRCARILFSKKAEAEEAFNQSQVSSPFPNAKVTFRLQYLSNERKTGEETGNPPAKPEEPTKLPVIEISQLVYVRGKLAGIAAMLEKPGGKISRNMKSELQSEVNDVLEKVSAMVGTSS